MEEMLESIIALMKEITENTEDIVWLNDHVTIFERLAQIYLEHGFEYKLKEAFLKYF